MQLVYTVFCASATCPWCYLLNKLISPLALPPSNNKNQLLHRYVFLPPFTHQALQLFDHLLWAPKTYTSKCMQLHGEIWSGEKKNFGLLADPLFKHTFQTLRPHAAPSASQTQPSSNHLKGVLLSLFHSKFESVVNFRGRLCSYFIFIFLLFPMLLRTAISRSCSCCFTGTECKGAPSIMPGSCQPWCYVRIRIISLEMTTWWLDQLLNQCYEY